MPALPPKLLQQFRALRGRLWQTRALEWACLGGLGGLALFLTVWLSDRLWDTPSLWRGGLLTGVGLAWLGAGLCLLVRWGLPFRRWDQLGRFVRTWNRRLGDRMLAVLDLAEPEPSKASESPRLREAAMEQMADQLGETDLNECVDRTQLQRASTLVSGLALLVVALLLIAPHAGMNAAVRGFLPWKDTPRYTFVQLADLPDEKVVPHGEPIPFQVSLKKDSPWKRTHAKALLPHSKQTLEATLEEDKRFHFTLPGLLAEDTLEVRVGDAVQRVALLPKHRPGLERLEAQIVLPTYLQRPAMHEVITAGRLSILSGSEVTLTGTVSRELAAAHFRGIDSQPLRVEGSQFFTHSVSVKERPQILEVAWEDQLGLESKEALRVELRPLQDKAPRVELNSGTTAALAFLAHDTVSFGLRAEDDFGLRALGFAWGPAGSEPEAHWESQSRLAKEGGPLVERLEDRLVFAPQSLGLEPGTWQLWAYAQDYRPGSGPSFSAAKVLQVLTESQHAAMVRSQFKQVQEELESVARAEANLLQENQALAQAETLDPEALQKQQEAEEAMAEQLAGLTTQAQALLEQALKNQSIDTGAMETWGEMLGAMQSVAQTGMPKAGASLGQASGAAAAGQAGEAQAALAAAMAQQEENLKQLAEAMGEAQATEEKLEAGTFVNRLRAVATAEEQVAQEMKSSVFRTAGLAPLQLGKPARDALGKLAESHEIAHEETRYLMNDLDHYHRRTSKPIYGQVHGEMLEAKVTNGLSQITQRVKRNQHGRVIQSSLRWAKQFHAWADALAAARPPKEEENPENGSGESEGKADTETLLAIMRLVQREMALRDQTRALDRRREHQDYTERARGLAEVQRELGFDVAALLAKVFGPEVQMRLRAAGVAMSDAALLLEKPETGGETIAAETEVIELLGQAAESEGQMSGNSKGLEALAELLSLMEIGNSPGGNPEGAASSLAARATTGAALEDKREERRIDKTSGHQSDGFPEEFREALGEFFERREALLRQSSAP